MRKTFFKRIAEMIRNETDTVYLTVDIGMWALRNELAEFPDRCMNFGIFEDGMISVAAGLSRCGLTPTVFGIQPYLIERTLEQIKMDCAYQKLGINVVGTGAAFDYPKYGYSHYCPEDAYIVKGIPGCEFIAPGTPKQFMQLFNQTYKNGHPTFFRISDHPNQINDPDVVFGKANIIKQGNKATIVVVSILLDMVIEACKDLDVAIIYYTTLEPFDKNTLSNYYNNGKIVVVEPEFKGTLDYDIISTFPNKKITIEHIGLPREIFRNYGTYDEKINYYGITLEKMQEAITKIIV